MYYIIICSRECIFNMTNTLRIKLEYKYLTLKDESLTVTHGVRLFLQANLIQFQLLGVQMLILTNSSNHQQYITIIHRSFIPLGNNYGQQISKPNKIQNIIFVMIALINKLFTCEKEKNITQNFVSI